MRRPFVPIPSAASLSCRYMERATATVLSPTGLHAGPARRFVQEAKKYPCMVSIRFRGREFNAKSMIGVLGAGVYRGDVIEIVCQGEREQEACRALCALAGVDMDEKQKKEEEKRC